MSSIFAEGERVKIVGTMSGHGQPIGTIMTVKGYNGQFVQVFENGMSYYEVDLESAPWSIEDAESLMVNREKAFINARSRVEFMKETGKTNIREGEFRNWNLSKIINSNVSVEDKIKMIESAYHRVA